MPLIVVHGFSSLTACHDLAQWITNREPQTNKKTYVCHEIDTLAALWSRQGATLRPMLRAAYMGEALGFGYADPRKRVISPKHAYRLGLIIGVQPEHAEALLNDQDVDGGTPQRILWLPTEDAAITADDVTVSPLVIKEAPAARPNPAQSSCRSGSDERSE